MNMNYQVKPYTCIKNAGNYYHHQLSVGTKIGTSACGSPFLLLV